jgi:ferredoxin-type protein NapF
VLHVHERRQFLRGDFRSRPAPLLPPWAGPRSEFLERCTRCGACLTACPSGILAAGDGDYPTVDFHRGECTFCGACVGACGPRALHARGTAPWSLIAVVHESCLAWQGIDCRRCGELCASGALRIFAVMASATLPVIDAPRCTGCGACVAPCPVTAIQLREAA